MRPVARTAPRALGPLLAAVFSCSLAACEGPDAPARSAEYLEQRERAKALLADVENVIEGFAELRAADLDGVGAQLDELESRLAGLPAEGDHPIAIERARDRLEVARKLYDKLVEAHTSARGAADELAAAQAAADAGKPEAAKRAFARAEHHALTLKGTRVDVSVPLPAGPASADAALREIRLARARAL